MDTTLYGKGEEGEHDWLAIEAPEMDCVALMRDVRMERLNEKVKRFRESEARFQVKRPRLGDTGLSEETFTNGVPAQTGQNPYALHGFADDYDVNA